MAPVYNRERALQTQTQGGYGEVTSKKEKCSTVFATGHLDPLLLLLLLSEKHKNRRGKR